MASPLAKRLDQALAQLTGPRPTPTELARIAGVKPPSVLDWFNGRTKSLGKALLPLSAYFGVTPEWLASGKLPMRPTYQDKFLTVSEAAPEYGASYEIQLLNAPGSCGEGYGVMELNKPVIKDAAWFSQRGVSPGDVFGIRAEGDAMADFITNGDLVLFDGSKTEPVSGSIFVVQHPAGLKIKRIRLAIDGSWMLENLNGDKQRFPDERIPPEHTHLLVIRGQYLYREG